ncbi:MAG: helix-turn-helix transcriptional regulator [Staphylococcus warneri]|uniref:helix-turn-helix domain-containing protein n=1 Tax=Bacillati TaxID=1783272 RepID=UPI0002AD617C|nr:helix-turn-helix transcriptional regulator [Staphylococcus warneri]AGC90923.1 transciptional regulator [Staphylococcus warneri SG1]KEK47683.1 helix-turn-helix family protein [Staphylococcus warneri Lyso 1 2011]KEK53188.1 helix-turn-helix family protein [Staphylococcus warneri Lyso 2 2011]KTW16728.1 DNA-binding helix-turn-helix protein [Staphylococcus warneri]MCM3051252.1 helix-turn-helix domain-containing protein [Staphylococcus warneri]
MVDRFDVGERINERRTRLGMTQKELASKTDTTKSTVQKWESGVHLPKKETIPKIAGILKYSEEYLLYGSDSNE